jgi:hypothetical protein
MSQVQVNASSSPSAVEQAQDKVQQTAKQATGAVRSAVTQRLDSTASQGAEQLQQVAQAFRSTAEQLRSQGNGGPAGTVESLAGRVESAANYLSETSADGLLRDAEHFGRRNPWVVIGGGLVAGLAASRLLKASSSRRFEQLRQSGYTSRQRRPNWELHQLPTGPTTLGPTTRGGTPYEP